MQIISLLALAVAGTAQTYSIVNQEPASSVPYPDSFLAKRLPNAGQGGPLDHLARNSDRIVREMLTEGWERCNGCGTTKLSKIGGISYYSQPGDNDGGTATHYYATQSDPIYRLTNCVGPLAGRYQGLTFHAPNAAQFSANCNGGRGCAPYDGGLMVWDQTQDITVALYSGNSTRYQSLPPCDAHDPAKACPADPDNGYCSSQNRTTGRGYDAGNAAGTNGLAPYAGGIRMRELESGHIYHALYLNTLCTADTTAWPASDGGYTAQRCSCLKRHVRGCSSRVIDPTFKYQYRPQNGALVFLDYTDAELDCLDPRKPVCQGIEKLSAWQYPVIKALTYYGGYIGDTGSYGGLYTFPRMESGQAYKYYQTHGYPNAWHIAEEFYKWLDKSCDREETCSRTKRVRTPPRSAVTYLLSPFNDFPEIDKKGILGHMHIADECVAKELAQVPGGCAAKPPKHHK